MSFPFVIWTTPRTGGTALSAALKAVSEHPAIDDEPFQYGEVPQPWAHVYEAWMADPEKDAWVLGVACRAKYLFKHIPEAFDDDFNIALAQAAEANGYRHINLQRRDEFARLVSRDIAQQLNAWQPHDSIPAIADVLAGRRELKPLDVPHLIDNYRLGVHRWKMIRPHLGRVLDVYMEDFAGERPWLSVQYIVAHLGLPEAAAERIREAVKGKGQDSQQLYHLIPNLEELRMALRAEGVM